MTPAGAVKRFTHEVPSVESNWRAIILFGKNVASYKFALAASLLDLGAERDEVPLEELAGPFACRIAEHLVTSDRQGTFSQSRFLDSCRAFNRGEIGVEVLRDRTVELGFNNVIDAFHLVDGADVATRFFVDERRASGALRLTDSLRRVTAARADLHEEVEARWRLVETAWSLNLPRRLLTVEFERSTHAFVVPRRRSKITGARPALNGYQKGHCFYCFGPISISASATSVCHVDHVFPWALGSVVGGAPVDGAWNLVLACARCNGWQEKSDRPPHATYVERLHRRNEFLIASHHPLRQTLRDQTGATSADRVLTLQRALVQATGSGVRRPWRAPEEHPSAF